jgi:ethanolamine utilization microcompartment shell protein EutS
MSDSQWGFGFEIGFIDQFNRKVVITHNYSAIADLHTLQITRGHRLVFCSRSVTVYTSHFPVTASNS